MPSLSRFTSRPVPGSIVRASALVAALLLPVTPALGQSAQIPLDRLDNFGEKAEETVRIDLDERVIRLALGFLGKEEAEARAALQDIKAIYVRHFSFAAADEYATADVDAIRASLQQAGWVRMVQARSKRAGDNADVFMALQGDRMSGLAIVVSNPKEVTVVNIVGSLDPERLRHLGGKMGIPALEISSAPREGAKP
jgi:hypothetical protein